MTDGEKVIEIQQMTGLSWKELAERIGMASSQSLTDIRAGRHGISMRIADNIVKAFPNIRKEWLVLGTGPMTTEDEAEMIALYNSPEELSSNKHAQDSINVGSCFPKAEIAMRNMNDSMVEYPIGCILVMRRVMDKQLLVPGNNYLVETNEFATVKRLQKGKDDAHIALYSSNVSTYPDGRMIYEPFEIPMDSVRRIFFILGYIYPQASDINKV